MSLLRVRAGVLVLPKAAKDDDEVAPRGLTGERPFTAD
jgi:hypothetical protein